MAAMSGRCSAFLYLAHGPHRRFKLALQCPLDTLVELQRRCLLLETGDRIR
jgi:hypothetical protein